MHKLRDIGIAALLAALSMQALAASGAEPQALVTIDTGKLRGQVEDALAVYRGVPFAAPPIGDLRWRAPQPAAKWDGVKEALKFGPRCQQLPLETAPWLSKGMVVSEGCLTLNVWGPKDTKKKVPVMVWIHGGAFTMGAGSEAPYQGQHLAGRGVVVVTSTIACGRWATSLIRR
ncbi:MAG: carboxylesterase family protein [Steroidobacteraceae bacterium]